MVKNAIGWMIQLDVLPRLVKTHQNLVLKVSVMTILQDVQSIKLHVRLKFVKISHYHQILYVKLLYLMDHVQLMEQIVLLEDHVLKPKHKLVVLLII
jgi:hypothetical protein